MEIKPVYNFTIVTTVVMAIVTISAISIFFWLYDVSKDNINRIWENKTEQLSHRLDMYLKLPINAVSFSGQTLNKMLKENQPTEVALKYLVEETKIYARLIPENMSGVYALYKNEYLDGSEWVPDPSFAPRERPWYTAAVKGNGRILISDPYLNFQTKTLMMSVSQLLSDKDSVVSMDIFLDGFQKIVQRFSEDRNVTSSFLMNKDGLVLAGSDVNTIGKNSFSSGSKINDAVSKGIQSFSKDSPSHIKFFQDETLFIANVYEGLFLVVDLNEDEVYHSLWSVYMVSSMFILGIIAVYILIFVKMVKKYKEADTLYKEVQAMYLFVSKD